MGKFEKDKSIEQPSVGSLASDLIEALDVTFAPLLEQSGSVRVLGGATASGTPMRRAMLWQGFRGAGG